MGRPKSASTRGKTASIRLTEGERIEMEESAHRHGFRTVSDYLRHLHAQIGKMPADQVTQDNLAEDFPASLVKLYHSTRHGTIYQGDSRGYLFGIAIERSVDLIVTSPPFGLVRKKQYGNENADLYCEWFRPFAEGFRRVLKDTGSLVIDIGGAWIPGQPTRSL